MKKKTKERKVKITKVKKTHLSKTELQALRTAYGKPLTSIDYLKYTGLPAILFGFVSYYLSYVWWIATIFGIIGVFFGLRVLLPKTVKRSYEIESFNQRNRLLNLMTQQMSDRSKIPKQILERVVGRLDGELKSDFFPITARIANGATSKEISEMFNAIQHKYKEDIIFSQYLEQVETNFTTGLDNLSSLKDMNGYHNDIRKQRDLYLGFKGKRMKDNYTLIIMSLSLITALQFATGNNEMYVNAFAKSSIGIGISIAYTLIIVFIAHKFQKIYFDDNIMNAN